MRETNNEVVKIITVGGDDREVEIFDGMTLENLFEEESITVGSAQTVWVNGKKVLPGAFDRAVLDAGDEIQIVGKKEGGRK